MTAVSRSKTRSSGSNWPVVLIFTLMLIPTAAWRGFVASKLWGWFAVPLGLPQIGVWQAAGLSLLVGLMANTGSSSDDEEKSTAEKLGYAMVYATLLPLLFLGTGALYHWLGG